MTDYNQLDFPNLTDETERLCSRFDDTQLNWWSTSTVRELCDHMRALQAELDKAQARVAKLENNRGHAGNHLFPDTSCHICGPNYIGRCPHGAAHG